ncbi:MAG TPA: hypothetical protein VGV61_08930 [Thermoanaerobaculia bacterium]|jgi:hypothetical protein|nr:hypothetical protein [Thermoanaerobaculia bacterium]
MQPAPTAPPALSAPLGAAAIEPVVTRRRRGTRAVAARLGVLALGLALLLYYPTLRNSWAYDDIDYINQAADALARKQGHGYLATLLRPQGEHIVSGFRLLLFASLKLFGIAALPFRLLVLIAHAASAVFLGLLARRYSSSAAAAVAATTLYVAACGLSSMWIWFPSGASVPFATAALTAAMLALAHRHRLGQRRARLLAGAAVVVALFTESTLVPLVALPIVIDEHERRQEGAGRFSLGAFTLFCLGAAVGMAALVSSLSTRTFGPHLRPSLVHGLPSAAFLMISAPLRLAFPGLAIAPSEPGPRTAVVGSLLGLVVAAAVSALLLVLWRRALPRLAVVAALCALGPLGWLVLVGSGRWRSNYWDMYEADRYYFPLLVPLALLAGAVAATAPARLGSWPRRQRLALAALLVVALGSELVLHRRAMLGEIRFGVYAAHEARFAQLQVLARLLEQTAATLPADEPPLSLPDAQLWFPDVHNGYLGTSVLLEVCARGGGSRLRLGGARVSARDARLLNPVLEDWAREVGEPLPYLTVDASGQITDAHLVRMADFRRGPDAGTVVSGFYDWVNGSRWMGKRGELRVTLTSPGLSFVLAAPMDQLRAAGIAELDVAVTAVDEATARAVPLGMLKVNTPGIQLHRLDATPFLSGLGDGRRVHLVLAAHRTWRPVDVLPASSDPRELSIMVLAAGCE